MKKKIRVHSEYRQCLYSQNIEYYEIEESDAHGGAVFYEDCILDIIQEFCSTCLKTICS